MTFQLASARFKVPPNKDHKILINGSWRVYVGIGPLHGTLTCPFYPISELGPPPKQGRNRKKGPKLSYEKKSAAVPIHMQDSRKLLLLRR